MAPGRNEPCPCGSGRKFKRCCGATEASDAVTPSGADREAAWNLLDRVSCLPRFQDDVECGFTLIWGEDWQSPEIAGMMNSPIGDLFYEWLWLDHQLHTGQTVAEYALHQHTADTGPGSRRFLRACAEAPLRLVQIERVEAGARVHVRDLLDRGPSISVTERAGSEQLVRHDLLVTRIAQYGDDAQFEGMNLRLPVGDKRWIAAEVRRLRKPLAAELPDSSARRRLLRMATGAALVRAGTTLLNRPLPQLQTSDGDQLAFADVIFTVLDPPAVRTALEGTVDIERQDPDPESPDVVRYTWLETAGPSSAGRRVMGTVVVDETSVRVETLSMARARDARARFESAVPPLAMRFKGISVQSPQPMIDSSPWDRASSPADDLSPQDPALLSLQRQFMEQHYREWLDISVPALDGRTPRQAAGVKRLRTRLRDLVEGIENQADREAKVGAGFDAGFLRKELGLE